VLGLVAGFKPASEAWRDYIRRDSEKFSRQVEEILRPPFVEICQKSGLAGWNVTAHAFLLRRRRWKPWQQELQQKGRLSLGPSHHSGVHWTKGKGAIGQCWREYEQDNARVTWGADVSEHRSAAMERSAEEWDKLPFDKRLGLTRAEYARATAAGVIFACVIDDDQGRFHGCVSLDGPAGCQDQMNKPEVWEAMKQAARGIWLLESKGKG
jgi:hypothetical protein